MHAAVNTFLRGSKAEYNGLEQASAGNIVILINYRLSIFGFLSYFDPETKKSVGGNYGLMDMLMALEFTKNNAENFGAQPGQIVINGESGGGWAVGALLMHPKVGKSSIYIKLIITLVCTRFSGVKNPLNDDIEKEVFASI